MYVSHDHIEELFDDYTAATTEYMKAKAALALAERKYAEAEARYAGMGLIHGDPNEHGKNETLRKLHAIRILSMPWGKDVELARQFFDKAEIEYETLRREVDSVRLHLQLMGLRQKDRELYPNEMHERYGNTIIRAVSPQFTFFDEMAPFDETDYEKTLRAIRGMIATEEE